MPDIERVYTESNRDDGFTVRIARRLTPGALTEVVIRLDNADNVYVLASYHGDTTINVSVGPPDTANPIRSRLDARLLAQPARPREGAANLR